MRIMFFVIYLSMILAFHNTSVLAGELIFGYKGVPLGSTEKEFKKKHKNASCFTNAIDKTRECVIRNTTYANMDVDEVRATFAQNQLGQIKITFANSIHHYDRSMSYEENTKASSSIQTLCVLDARTLALEERYGAYHKDFMSKITGGYTDWRFWYGINGNLSYVKKFLIDENLSASCTAEITIELKDFNKLIEKQTYGSKATNDM